MKQQIFPLRYTDLSSQYSSDGPASEKKQIIPSWQSLCRGLLKCDPANKKRKHGDLWELD